VGVSNGISGLIGYRVMVFMKAVDGMARMTA
jgi:hypothetical protein